MFIQEKQTVWIWFLGMEVSPKVVSSQWVPIKTKILQHFAIVSEPPSKAIHQVVFSVTLEMGENNLRKAIEGSNKVTALIQKFTVNLICDTKGVGLEQL